MIFCLSKTIGVLESDRSTRCGFLALHKCSLMRVLESNPRTGLFSESAQMNLDATNLWRWKRRNGQGSIRASRRSVTDVLSRRSRRASSFLLEVLEDRIALTTFPVVTSFDSGPGSLRAAIAQAD